MNNKKQRMGFSFHFLIFFMLKIVADVGAVDECSRVASCNPHGGPPVRFPFRLRGLHPPHCGHPHPGFELSCTPSNLTVLELPRSVKLQVKHIDYAAQRIQLLSLPNDDCIQRFLQNLNLSESPFQFFLPADRSGSYIGDFILFNCSLPSEPYRDNTIPCLSNPAAGHRVQAVYSVYRISSLSLASCRKTDVLTSIPSYLMFDFDQPNINVVHLNWSSPSCVGCERNGRGCKLKGHDSDQTECYQLPEHSRDARRKLLVASLVVCSFLLVVSAIGVYYVHRSYKLKKEHEFKIKQFLEDYKALKSTRYSYSDVKRITDGFKEKLGQGGYGSVYKGKLSNNVLVAVKILNNISTGNGQEFIIEVGSMGRIHHVNVARLVGYCADGSNRALVYEFLPNKSLDKYIFSENGTSCALGWEKLQDIAQGIAKGIEYLHHGCDQQILHFDIKPHNILLDHNFNPKISDFGLAKLCSKEKSVVTMTAARGTMGYIAPEVVSRNFGKASSKSDVYSFGMLLLEMAGGRKIVETGAEKGGQVPIPGGVEIEAEGDAKIANKLAKVALWCIQWYPVDRPSVKAVVQMLEGEGENVTMPPNPFASAERFGVSASRPAKSLHMELDIITETE